MACNEKRYSLSDAAIKSKTIIDYFKSNQINQFKAWQFFYRGGGGVWINSTNGHENFRVFYFSDKAYKKLSISDDFNNFFLVYPLTIEFDTSNLTRIVFQQTDRSSTQIKFEYANTAQLKEISKEIKGEIFQFNNPFEEFDNYQHITNKLNVYSIDYSHLKDCITFLLFNKYKLEYFPDSTISKLNYRQYLANSDLKIFWLERNWFLKYW